MFKDAATTTAKRLAYIINLSLQPGSVPMKWEAAKASYTAFQKRLHGWAWQLQAYIYTRSNRSLGECVRYAC